MGKTNITDALVAAVAIRVCNNDGCSWDKQPEPVKVGMRRSARSFLAANFSLVDEVLPADSVQAKQLRRAVAKRLEQGEQQVVLWPRRAGRTTEQLMALRVALQLYPQKNKQLLQANKVCSGVTALANNLLAARAEEVRHG